MALYEYKCSECDDHFDLMRSMSAADDPARCPDCSGGAARVMTTFVSIGSGAGPGSTNPMMDARMSRGAVGGGCCGGGCGCH